MSGQPALAIFDHDGVLIDSLDLHQRAWVELGRREGLPIRSEFIRETFGMTNRSILAGVLGREPEAEALARYSALKEECYRALARGRISLMAGVQALLDGLSARGVLLAIGSSSTLENLLLTIEECGLQGRFAAIASAEDITRGKPDPEIFLVAARKAGASPGGTVVFEDATYGVEAAKAAGMYAVGVTTTNPASVLHDAGADEVVDCLEDYDVDSLVARLGMT